MVKRYDVKVTGSYLECFAVMEDSPDGEYVKYKNVATLEAENALLRKVAEAAEEWTKVSDNPRGVNIQALVRTTGALREALAEWRNSRGNS